MLYYISSLYWNFPLSHVYRYEFVDYCLDILFTKQFSLLITAYVIFLQSDGLTQMRHNSSANALELCLFCNKPSKWYQYYLIDDFVSLEYWRHHWMWFSHDLWMRNLCIHPSTYTSYISSPNVYAYHLPKETWEVWIWIGLDWFAWAVRLHISWWAIRKQWYTHSFIVEFRHNTFIIRMYHSQHCNYWNITYI